MTLRRQKALPVTRRAVRAACLVVSMAALSISAVCQMDVKHSWSNPVPSNGREDLAPSSSERASGEGTLEPTKGAAAGSRPSAFLFSRKFLVPTFVTLQALDAGATMKGFSAPGWHESNPLVPHSTAGQAAYFGLTGAGVVLGTDFLERKGHRKLATIGRLIGIAVEGYASGSSLRGLQR